MLGHDGGMVMLTEQDEGYKRNNGIVSWCFNLLRVDCVYNILGVRLEDPQMPMENDIRIFTSHCLISPPLFRIKL